jgi:hypothetical protein
MEGIAKSHCLKLTEILQDLEDFKKEEALSKVSSTRASASKKGPYSSKI